MLIVTNTAAVDAAFNGAAPRPIVDAILAVYPDCTIDRNNRAHAPYDGYECPITGQLFRAGEYLPFEHDDESNSIYTGPAKRLPEAVDCDGRLHSWDGTRAQNRAVWVELVAQTRAHDAAVSRHVGKVGEMANFNLTIEFVTSYEGTFSTVWIYVMKDNAGNVFVYKGSKRFEHNDAVFSPYRKGEKVSLRAKVKAHGEREGVAQTILERPKIL